ncbi:MAG: hypothetical protein RIT27_906 [Pseudomonadota bacterium]|jgi:4-diphosphocytidyl-2-C-methyl-D-erythritol kinase
MNEKILTKWLAPAKLNLFLHIIGQREDGYHLLQTVFQFIDLCDVLEFEIRNDHQIVLESPFKEHDLIYRAAFALQQRFGVSQGVSIQIEKHIPIGGGLGGGSSDAATTLLALNEIWQLHQTPTQLADIGIKLGADVPVFVHGKAAWAEGIGEQFTSIELPEPYFVVIKPDCSVATADIFRDPHLTRNTKPITMRAFFAGQGHNDCQAVACKQYPAIQTALNWLNQFGTAKLTGTGACVFAAFEEKSQAEQIHQQSPWQSWVVKGYNLSPALQR